MKLLLGTILVWLALFDAQAQQRLGLNTNPTPGSPQKLVGIIIHRMPEGYLAVSVPTEDLKKFVIFVAKTELKLHGLGLLEYLDAESKRLAPTKESSAIPIGKCFLVTDEVFPRHKILDRNVQAVGSYTYVNLRGINVTVTAYAGGPTLR